MKLEQQVVSLELAKKLKELGVKQESLFYWQELELHEWEKEQNVETHCISYSGNEPCLKEDISAFTVAELLKILDEMDTAWSFDHSIKTKEVADSLAMKIITMYELQGNQAS